jgi:eukaryotic-like serine/threonine-protein kinase
MPLAPGTKLGPYEILDALGAGGMGEVYRARDARLGREVAVKILPDSFSRDADRLRRFEQEACAIAALNHPNILAIHDMGNTESSHHIVTELLEGENLRARLRIGPLPLRKSLEIALQAARGVSAAHDKGIVHRDLKPANLFITEDGRVKVLDFGLAKLASTANANQSESLTLVQAEGTGTAPGLLLGTVGYMSPEQVRGKPADTRSDIFALGVILYEMLSGKPAFQKESVADTIAAILNQDPPELSGEGKKIPPVVDKIVHHCLEKNPAERFQSARDLAFDLETASGVSTGNAAPPATTRVFSRNWIFAAALLGAIVVGALMGRLLGSRYVSATLPNFTQLTFDRGLIYSARFAPDGKSVYYAASWRGQPIQIYSTSPGSPESRGLDLTDSTLFAVSASQMAVSVGCKDVFIATCEGTLATVPVSGGAPREISGNVANADWTSDGTEMAVIRHEKGEYRVEFPLGNMIYASERWLDFVRISPRREYVAFVSYTFGGDSGRVLILDRKGKLAARSPEEFASVEGLSWSPDGNEVWFGATGQQGWANSIYAMTPSGKQRVVLRLPGMLRLYDVSRDGRVLLSKDIWRTELEFAATKDKETRSLTWFDCSVVYAIAAGGDKVAFDECGEASGVIYLAYLRKTDGSPPVKLGEGLGPVFSPDEKWVLVKNFGPVRLALLPTGIGETKQMNPHGMQDFSNLGWMPDGKEIYFAGDDGHNWRIYAQDLVKGELRPLTPPIGVNPIRQPYGLVSPDGRFCFSQDASGTGWLYPLTGGEPQAVKGLMPEDIWLGWTSDGHSVFVDQDKKSSALLFQLDPVSGIRRLIGKATPQDPSGLATVSPVRITPDGKAYAFTYNRSLSDLFIAEGLH